MYTFLGAITILILGYLFYGKFVEKVFGIDENRTTPAYTKEDGVDFVPMDSKRNSLIQLLNIAGLGPIFGPILGALWGPVAFLWIAFGAIFAGAVHDYFSGMLSIRNDGASLPKVIGKYLGKAMEHFINIFSVILLVLVGAVFMAGPAGLLAALTPTWMSASVWVIIILIYYILATLLPIDKVIGKVYPIFGAALIIMAVGIGGGLLVGDYSIPELTLENLHPKGLPLWPLLFITIACGAISGFHATQSPMIARCTKNEASGRKIFYGSMILEAIIAMVWAAAAMTMFNGTEGLSTALADNGGPAGVVRSVAMTMLGGIGGTLAVIGVIILPITSGDTAFRGARLVIADYFKYDQIKFVRRLAICIPLFAIGFGLTLVDFNFLWRYFAWANQTVAMITLWAAAVYLVEKKGFHWICSIPATFMTAVTFTYILQAPEGFALSTSISYPVGLLGTILVVSLFAKKVIATAKA